MSGMDDLLGRIVRIFTGGIEWPATGEVRPALARNDALQRSEGDRREEAVIDGATDSGAVYEPKASFPKGPALDAALSARSSAAKFALDGRRYSGEERRPAYSAQERQQARASKAGDADFVSPPDRPQPVAVPPRMPASPTEDIPPDNSESPEQTTFGGLVDVPEGAPAPTGNSNDAGTRSSFEAGVDALIAPGGTGVLEPFAIPAIRPAIGMPASR